MTGKKLTLQQKIEGLLWPQDNNISPAKLSLLKVLRISYVTTLDLLGGHISLRAMSLVYTTLLSIVPLLALSFSVLKAMGAHNEMEPFLFQFLAPLGEQGIEIGNNIISFIDNIKVGVLGSVGLGLLIYTVLSLVQKIENAFNMIWRVKATRSMGERFSNYLSVILIGPVLMVSALGMTATVMSSSFVQYFSAIEPFGTLIIFATKLLPYAMVIGVFMFVYMFVPNTRVRVSAAFIGALIAGFLWERSGVLFASFVVNSTNYTAIYSSFAILIMLLIWLYLSWLILLMGSNIAFYIQNPSYLRVERGQLEISNRVKERLALYIMTLLGRQYYQGKEALSLEDIVEELSMPSILICYVVNQLIEEKLLIAVAGQPTAFLPARALETILIVDIVKVARSAEEINNFSIDDLVLPRDVQQVAATIDNTISSALGNKTLVDLVREETTA